MIDIPPYDVHAGLARLSPLARRLAMPARRVDLRSLSESWFDQDARVRIEGFGGLARHPDVPGTVRRHWGAALMKGASSEAVAGRPCPWTPPCALDVFFREQLRRGRDGLAKPFVITTDRQGDDLVVVLRVFGLAGDWMPAALERLIEALAHFEFPWKRLGEDGFLPKLKIADAKVTGLTRVETPAARAAGLDFLSPMDATGEDPLDVPASVIGRLARRIDALARWQDALIDVVWDDLATYWRALDYDAGGLERVAIRKWSGRQQRLAEDPGVLGRLGIAGDLAPVMALLALGERTFIGRGAVSGFGRYRLSF